MATSYLLNNSDRATFLTEARTIPGVELYITEYRTQIAFNDSTPGSEYKNLKSIADIIDRNSDKFVVNVLEEVKEKPREKMARGVHALCQLTEIYAINKRDIAMPKVAAKKKKKTWTSM